MSESKLRPRVGVGVIVVNDGKLLLMKRKGSMGSGTWGLPGGKLDFGEAIEDCAVRETLEETGLKVTDPTFLTITNDITLEENNHFVTLYIKVTYTGGEPQNMEPEKCDAIEWFDPKNLPSPLFLPMQNLLKTDITII
jgi:8-oxo-dGTP diphosphatase